MTFQAAHTHAFVPLEIQCPKCGGKLRAQALSFEDQEEGSTGEGKMAAGVWVWCSTQPTIGGDAWKVWYMAHKDMYMCHIAVGDLQQQALNEVRAKYRFYSLPD